MQVRCTKTRQNYSMLVKRARRYDRNIFKMYCETIYVDINTRHVYKLSADGRLCKSVENR